MKALILVGGFGTRLRPLTLSFPKPLVDFANKPMILHQIEALKEVGVTEVVLAINYRPEVMINFLKDFEDKLGITITCSQETEPLGTAGPLALARDKLLDGSGEPFFVLNSDVISEYPFAELIQFHKSHGGEATIMVTKVDEPSKYGVVVMEDTTGVVERFVEKPKIFVGNKINAGIYLLNPSVLDRIELKPTSIEKEVFPRIAADQKLYAMVLPGFWMDIGQPRDYITGLRLYLDSLRKRSAARLANKPMILHQIEALKEVGVTEVVLAINYRPEVMINFLKDFEDKLGITITCSQETEPLGTAGPLALARDKLLDGSGEPFFVLNSDVISEYPFAELIQFHKSHGGEATIMVTKVDEPSKYGVVVMDDTTGVVEKFVEKPKIFVGNKINAGIYLLNPSVLDRIELKPTSIEKEVFPRIAADQKLYAMVLPGFWMDIGQPRDYITGLRLYLDSLRKRSAARLATGTHVVGNVLVHESAKIGEGCLIGPDVAIGPGCVVEDGVRLSRCTVMRGARIKKHACISNSIVGWHSTVGKWARIENVTILGEDVHVGDEVYSNGGVVLPHKEIKSSILKPEIVM